jgi:hypothetical protein
MRRGSHHIPHFVTKGFFSILGMIMKFAIRKRLIDFNPLDVVEKPKGRSRYNSSDEIEVYSPDEIRIFLDNMKEQKY